MTIAFDKNILREESRGRNFSLVLSDNSLFLSTEYKILQNQKEGCFVKCMKMMCNGHIELFYIRDAYRSLQSMISAFDENNFLVFLGNFFESVIRVKSNGFLDCCSILTSFDKIFIDVNTYEVRLVYVPVSARVHKDSISFENDIRTSLIKLISGLDNLDSPKMMQVIADLQNGVMSLSDLNKKYKGISSGSKGSLHTSSTRLNAGSGQSPCLKLVNAPTSLKIPITSSHFTIGKKSTCDGVISGNRMISRQHCCIITEMGEFYISDLSSANGTFVNNRKLTPSSKARIRPGDLVKLANMEFEFSVI